MSTNENDLNCSTSAGFEFEYQRNERTIVQAEDVIGVMKHECEEPYECDQCMTVCYPVFLTALDIWEVAGLTKAVIWLQGLAYSMGDNGVRQVLLNTLPGKWKKMSNLCRKRLLDAFQFREEKVEAEQRKFPKFEHEKTPQSLIVWNLFIGVNCPPGFSALRKKYIYASIDGQHYVNYHGVQLDIIQPNQRPTFPALIEDPVFGFLKDLDYDAQSAWNMTRKDLSRFSEHTKHFERWVREHSKNKDEVKRFIGIHLESPPRFLRQTQTATLSPVAWKFVKSVTDTIMVEYKKERKYDKERSEKYMDYQNMTDYEAQMFSWGLPSSLKTVGSNIQTASENLSNAGNRMAEQMSYFNQTLSKMTEIAAGTEQTTASRIMSTLHLMSTLITQLNPMMYLTGTPLAIHISSVIAWWSTAPSMMAVFGPLVALIKGCVGTTMVAQSGNDSYERETIISCFKEYFCTALGMSSDGKLNESRGRRIDLLMKTVMNASKLASMIWSCFHTAMEWILGKLDLMDTTTLQDRMTAFTIAADTFDLDETNPDAYRKIESREDMKDLANLIITGRRLMRECAIASPRVSGPVARSLSRIEAKFKQIRAYHFKETGAEMEPVSVWIEGAAGTGKTLMMDQLMTDVFAVLGRAYDHAYHKYVISKDSDYYDGLFGQPVIVLDDVFVINDPESDNKDIARIVSLTDGSVKHLNMADCDLKSCTYATPEFVLMTSNTTPSDSDLTGKLRAPNALMRRLDIIVKTTNKPGEGFEDQKFIIQEFKFSPSNLRQNGTYVAIEGKSSYMDLVELVAAKYYEHKYHRVSTDGRLNEEQISSIRRKVRIDLGLPSYDVVDIHPPPPSLEGDTDGFDDGWDPEVGVQLTGGTDTAWNPDTLRQRMIPSKNTDPNELDFEAQTADRRQVEYLRSNAYPGEEVNTLDDFRDAMDEYISEQVPYMDDIIKSQSYKILPGETWRERAYRYYARVMKKDDIKFPINIGKVHVLGCIYHKPMMTNYWAKYALAVAGAFAAYAIYHLVYKLARATINFFQPTIDAVKDFSCDVINKMAIAVANRTMKNNVYDDKDIIENGGLNTVHCHTCISCGQILRHRAILNDCRMHIHACTGCEVEGESSPEANTFSGAKARVVRLKRAAKMKGQAGKVVPQEISEQFTMHSASDTAAVETFYATSRNYITIQRLDRGVSVQGFVLQGNIVCTVGHFLSDLEFDDEPVTLVVDSIPVSNVTFKVTYDDLLFIEDADTVCFRLPKNVVAFRSIVHHFVDEEPVDAHGVMMPRLTVSGNRCVLTEKYCSDYRALGSQQYKYDGNYIVTNGCGSYAMPTSKGDCGNLIYLVDPTKSRKIVGFHIAGNGTVGICKVVTRDMALDIVAQMREKFPCGTSVSPVIEEELECDDDGEMVAQGMTAPQPIWEGLGYHPIGTSDVKIVGSGKSQYAPSIIHGKVYEVTHKPAKLRTYKNTEGIRIDPLHRGEVNKTDSWVPEERLDSIVDNMYDNIMMYPDHSNERRLLTETEAINGVMIGEKTLHPWIGAMEMKTSAGLPFIKKKSKGKGKTGLFEFEEGKYAMMDEVRDEYDKLKESIEKEDESDCLWPVFSDTKKDELLIAAKADAGRTRIFNVGPVHFNILCREYFGMFNAHIMANHNEGEVKVGLNVHSDEWKIFYNTLIRNSDPEAVSFLAGDWNGWDKSLSYQFCMAYIELANKWYADEYANRRIRIGQMMFSSFRQNGNQLYRVFGSLPSGIVMTAVGNSVINMALSRYVFMRCVEENMGDWREWPKLWQENVRCGFYGDDAIYTISNKYVDMFNMQSILEYGKEIGMKYTAPDKSDYVPKTMSETEVTFIKRRFVQYQGITLAPLEWISLCNMVNWRRSDMQPEDAIKATYNSFQIELLHYGMAVYTEETTKVRAAILSKGIWVEQKDWLRLFGEVWGHFATLSYVDKATRIVNILDAAVDEAIHHVRDIERHPNGKLKHVDWCPRHVQNVGRQAGGKSLSHHICMGCKRVVLATFDDASKCVKGYCLACLGSPVPSWYIHEACLECM